MKNQIRLLIALFALLLSVNIAEAQIAGNPPYTLDQSVIAGGGGTSADAGNIFSVTGAIGQSIAGTNSTNSPFTVNGGFFTPASLAPTAASVSVAGRILTPDGRGLKMARVILTDMQGSTRTAMTGTFGYYHFVEVEAGQTYIVSVISKRYQFAPQVVNVMEDIEELNFAAQFETRREK